MNIDSFDTLTPDKPASKTLLRGIITAVRDSIVDVKFEEKLPY